MLGKFSSLFAAAAIYSRICNDTKLSGSTWEVSANFAAIAKLIWRFSVACSHQVRLKKQLT
jgi:hypothetical protein